MSKILVCYFSASGTTAQAANKIANAVNADLFEVEPVNKYTTEDLDWTNSDSRTSKEMLDENIRPEVKNKIDNIKDYDKFVIGYPIWWYKEPPIIKTFIEENNFDGKKVYLFATSGSSDEKTSYEDLKKNYPNIKIISAKRFSYSTNDEEIKEWLK